MVSGKRHMAACSFRNGAEETNQEETPFFFFFKKVLLMKTSFDGLKELGIPQLGTQLM